MKDNKTIPRAYLNMTAQLIRTIVLGIEVNMVEGKPEKIKAYLDLLRELAEELRKDANS